MDLYEAPRHRRAIRCRRAHFLAQLASILGLLAALVFLLVAAVGPAPAHAQERPLPILVPTPVDPQLQATREEARRQAAASFWCAYDGTTALVRAGAQDEGAVMATIAKWCGRPLVAFLQLHGMPEDRALYQAAVIINAGYEHSVAMMKR